MAGSEAGATPNAIPRIPTILMVDDEPLIRMAMSDYLQQCGFEVLEASNAAEAVKIITQRVVVIDLVFSDVQMPGDMNGFGLAKWIRENYSGLPVILASGYTGKAHIAQEICAGEKFFSKPYEFERVANKIRNLIEGRKTAGQ